ncbi:hypothetical protein [Streptomyces sp. NPDC060001]|uniref:hypothetical protein n=1 Tax=Streptomyces sp. NPDC060001 TaxID=3347032 RepID=UPI003685E691
MTTHDVKITTRASGCSSIELDGQPLRGVRSFVLRAGAGERPELELEVLVHDISTFAEAIVLVPSDTAETLVALGWKPPPEQEVDSAAP